MYHHGLNDLSAFVLAGGKSARMGCDKAFLQLGNSTLLERATKLAASVTENVFLVGDAKTFFMHESVIEDVYRERGPLGGIHAALSHAQTELNLFIAVDTPFIERNFLDFLASEARNRAAVVTLPRSAGHLHPLCAIYRREFAPVCEKALIRGHNRIDVLFAEVQTRIIEEEELIGMGFRPEMFRNINTGEDWRQAEACLREQEKDIVQSERRS